MKKIIAIIFLVSLGLYAQDFMPLKPLGEYKSSDYNLKDGVEYLEIRTYFGQAKSVQEVYNETTYKKEIAIHAKSDGFLDENISANLKAVKPNLKDSDIRKHRMCRFMGCNFRISVAVVLFADKNITTLNKVSDVTAMLGKIDTPAELKLVLWLNDINKNLTDHKHSESYKKVKNGYEVISVYENNVMNFGECGVFKHKLLINDDGKIGKKILLEKIEKDDCVVAD